MSPVREQVSRRGNRYLAALRLGALSPSFHMTRIPQFTSASVAATVLAVVLCLGPAQNAGADQPHASNAHGFGTRMLQQQNAERRRHGLRGLRLSSSLNRAARRHARDMVRRHYFGHFSHGGHDVVDRVGSTRYGRRHFVVQENLYWWNRKRSPAAVLGAWLNSAVHRANVLNRAWHQFGIGVLMRSPYGRGVTVVGVYGAHPRG